MKFDELKPGMLVKDEGLLRDIVINGKSSKGEPISIFGGKNAISFFDINDPYYGSCSRAVKDNTNFEILHEIGSIEYKKVLLELAQERAKNVEDALKDIKLILEYVGGKTDEKLDEGNKGDNN